MTKNNWHETLTSTTTIEDYKNLQSFLKENKKVKDRLKSREIAVKELSKIKYNIQLYHGISRDIIKETYNLIMKDNSKKVLHFSYTNTNGLSNG